MVYRAWHRRLNRVEAVKLIRLGPLADPKELARFRLEAEASATLDHPNIVPVYGAGEVEGQPYLAMKWVDGGSLATRVSEFHGSLAASARLVAALARAVQYAHEHGILHRDLKPGNILLDQHGQPYVTDFGLAKYVAITEDRVSIESLTQTGAIVGTPSYMAPEQASGQKNLTAAVDVYGLGTVLYELLTGESPFKGNSVLEILEQVRSQEPVRPRTFNTAVPRNLETICLKCLEKEPSRRYGSAADLADDLERWLRQEPIRARPTSWPEHFRRWHRRRPARAVLHTLGGLFLVVVAVWLVATRDASLREVVNAGVLKVATDPTYPPMEYHDESGKLVGFDIELARSIAEDLGVACEFVHFQWNWPELVQELNTRQFDLVISGVQITEERKEDVAFIDYLKAPHHFIYKPGLQFGRAEDNESRVLAGKVVAVPQGTTTEVLIDKLQHQGVNIKEVKRVKGNRAPLALVRAGEADVTLLHFPAAVYFARPDLMVSKEPVGSRWDPDSMGIALRQQDRMLKARIEQVLAKMKQDGRFKKLQDQLPQ